MSTEAIETPKTFTLITPIEADGPVTEVTLREPTVGQIDEFVKDDAKDGGVSSMIKLVSKQTKLAPHDVRKLGARDFRILTEYLGLFLDPKKETSAP